MVEEVGSVSLLRCVERKRDKEEIMIEKQFSRRSGLPVTHGYSVEDGTEAAALFSNEIGSRCCESSSATIRNGRMESMRRKQLCRSLGWMLGGDCRTLLGGERKAWRTPSERIH